MKTRIRLLIILLISLLCLLYVFKGKNWLSEFRLKKRQQNREFLFNKLIDDLLDVQNRSQKIINEFLEKQTDFVLFPDQNIEIIKNWEIPINFPVSFNPVFDYKAIYLAGGRKIASVNKKNHEILWLKTMPASIISIQLTDANRIVLCLKNDKIINLSRITGKTYWDNTLSRPLRGDRFSSAVNISLERYLQLESSLIVIPSTDSLTIINNFSGKKLAVYDPEKNIRFISDFDLFTKSLYIIEDNYLLNLELKVVD